MKMLLMLSGLLSFAFGVSAQLLSSANTNASAQVAFYALSLTQTPHIRRISRPEFRSRLSAGARFRPVPSKYFPELQVSPWTERRRDLHLIDMRN
jgi:hypothetical protein